MTNLGNIETTILNNLREIEKNLIHIQEKVGILEIAEIPAKSKKAFNKVKVKNIKESRECKFYGERESYDVPEDTSREDTSREDTSREDTSREDTSRVDYILESAKKEIKSKARPKKKINKGAKKKQILGFSNYVVDTSSSDDE